MAKSYPLGPKLPGTSRWLQAGLLILILKVFVPLFPFLVCPLWLDDLLSFSGSLCLLLSASGKRFTLPSLLAGALLFLLAAITSLRTGQVMLFLSLITIFALSQEKDGIRFLFYAESIVLAGLMSAGFLFRLSGGEMRILDYKVFCDVFGFLHPNSCGLVFWNLAAMWSWLHYEKLSGRSCLFLAGFFVLLYLATDCRTALVAGLILSFLLWLAKRKEGWVAKTLMMSTELVVPFFSILIGFLISIYTKVPVDGLVRSLDHLLSNRLRLGAFAREHFGLTFFGQKLDYGYDFGADGFWSRQHLGTLDSVYTFFLTNYGAIWLVVLAIAFWLLARRRDNRLNVFLLVWALYSVTETITLNGYLAFPILLCSLLFTDGSEKEARYAL